MAKKRWMTAMIAEAKKNGDVTAEHLPFSRQMRRVQDARATARAPIAAKSGFAKKAIA
ncbi:MAG: hypothetical protein AAF841_08205 [Pseudomonadota bacterium]